MGTAGVIDLSVWQLAVAVLLVGVIIVVSIRQALGIERDLVIGSIRTVVQLYGVGLILTAVFAEAQWYWVVLIVIGMTGVATQAALSRLQRADSRWVPDCGDRPNALDGGNARLRVSPPSSRCARGTSRSTSSRSPA